MNEGKVSTITHMSVIAHDKRNIKYDLDNCSLNFRMYCGNVIS